MTTEEIPSVNKETLNGICTLSMSSHADPAFWGGGYRYHLVLSTTIPNWLVIGHLLVIGALALPVRVLVPLPQGIRLITEF